MANVTTDRDSKTFDVIVVGAGIMGSCTAYQTAKRGQKTLLLEQFDFLHNRASSHGESRTIRATYPSPHYSSMVLESASLWRQAESEIGYQVYHKTPQLDIGPSSAPGLRAIIQNLRPDNASSTSPIGFKILKPHELAARFNGNLSVPDDWIGVLSDVGGVIKPTKAVSMFQALAIKKGAVLRDNTKVSHISKDQARRGGGGVVVVRTANGGVFYGRKCVVTCGAWMRKLLESTFGIKVPIQPLETFLCYWKVKEGHEDDYSLQAAGFPTFASYGYPRIYGTPCFEYPGLFKACLHEGAHCDPDTRNWSITKTTESLELLKKWVKDRFHGAIEHEAPAATQSCMYSVTPDEDYIIDFLGGAEFGKDVVIAGGFSGHGFKMGPVVGRILADLAIDGHAPRVNMDYFSLSRFQKNPKGNVKDVQQVGRANL